LQRAAPPRDLRGAASSGYPGVGAHAIHLYASETHGAVACNECHVVPASTAAAGHADDARPAELAFGAVASTGRRKPVYDAVGRTCANSWCHRDQADAVWTEPRTSAAACGSCHGLPPSLPHPQSERCEVCHGDVIDAERHFVDAALHVDGKVQASPGDCSSCHGSADDPAPPSDTRGHQSISAIGVGAHRAHLSGGVSSRALECAECHRVPKVADDAGHIEGLPARVVLTGIAATAGRNPSWDRVTTSCSDSWCHGPSAGKSVDSPRWTSTGDLGCASCHGAPPAAPHPQLDNCSACHGAVVGPDNTTIIDRLRHVNGVVDVDFQAGCTSCHGAESPAPPRDVAGHSDSSFAGVGAHQAHLGAGVRARAVACTDCHVVPDQPFAVGHLDSALPAELSFSGVATAFDAAPTYQNGACASTACHGGKFPGTHRSGGSNITPVWTKVDGTQATCGSCHGLPPPPPHPYQSNCSQCHENMAPDNLSFVRPDLHVDGSVTFTWP
jgi:predicted CxxxxCH...CXXCH cytochrome family protein